jgi:RNA polymerase sigma-70 factor (ECF subfamily)
MSSSSCSARDERCVSRGCQRGFAHLELGALGTSELGPASKDRDRPQPPPSDGNRARHTSASIELPPRALANAAQARCTRRGNKQWFARDRDRRLVERVVIANVAHESHPRARTYAITRASISSRVALSSGRKNDLWPSSAAGARFSAEPSRPGFHVRTPTLGAPPGLNEVAMNPQHRIDTEALLAHAGWMRALAYSLLGDPAAADDVVQDATIAALMHAPSRDTVLKPWLSRVVRNFAFRRRRGEARRAEHEARASSSTPELSPADTLERLDLQRTLVESVRAIEEPLRTTLVMRYFEGKSCAEIARLQRVPAGTVRWRLKRALDELRRRLDARSGSRDNWVALIAPFAPRPIAATTSGGTAMTGSKILTGVLAMKAAELAATAAALVIVCGVAWWGFSGSREQPVGGATTVAPQPMTARGILDSNTDTTGAPQGPVDATAARASIAAKAAYTAPSDARASQPAARITIVDVRFVDEHGRPWSGVSFVPLGSRWLPNWKPGEGVDSEADGRAVLSIRLPADRVHVSAAGEVQIELVASHSGCSTIRRSATLRAGETVHLGDVVLGPGVRLQGRAIDENGNGIALATIGVAPVELPEDQDRMRRHGSDAFSEVPGAQSSTDGAFVLEGVAPGRTRIWAHAEGMRYAWSAPIEVPSDSDGLGLEIVLTPLLASDRITGRVVGPNDEPIANADIWFAEHSRGSGMSTSTPVDAEGRFALLVQHEDSTYDFTARDRQKRFAATTVQGVRPGSLAIVIRMHEKRFLTLHVHDADGGPVPAARFEVMARGSISDETAANAAPGDYSIVVPDGAFHLTVAAHGYRSTNLGPLDAATLPATLDVVLQRAPVVRGRVIANGAPVAGARVHLLHDYADATGTVSGYRFRYMVSQHELGTLSDAEGRFQLDCDEARGYWLRATAEGWAPGEVGPRDGAQLGAENEIDIELTKGGAIEGHVLLPDGRNAEGTILAINHGDGSPRTLRAGPKGSFHVDGLTPGRWQVLPAQSEIDPLSTMYSSVKTDAPIEWSCEVSAGRTTRYDVDLTKP